MEMGLIRGLITLAVFVLFMAIALWSYSKRRQDDFAEAADLPLMSDAEAGMASDAVSEKNDE